MQQMQNMGNLKILVCQDSFVKLGVESEVNSSMSLQTNVPSNTVLWDDLNNKIPWNSTQRTNKVSAVTQE